MLMRHHLNRLAETDWQRGHPLGVVSSIAGTLNFNLAAQFGIRGSTCGFVSACTSGSHALGFAFDEIALGRQRRMLVVAAEDLNLESLLPFHCMNALTLNPDPATASRPFAVGRDGFVATGGGVAIVLEDAESAHARGIPVQARVAAWAQAGDGYHVAHPNPEGIGLRTAMERVLAAGEIDRSEIDYINAHATSTPTGDLAESRALREVFAAHHLHPPVSSTKALTGHGLSLAGAMEAAFCILALREGFIPGQPEVAPIDPACSHLNIPHTTLANAQPRVILNNNSGFGGSNVCHLFAAP
jgi:3-oxoacyl-(acyl-carrier-protein) synthase